MANRKRKHGVFAVNGDVVVLSNATRVDYPKSSSIYLI